MTTEATLSAETLKAVVRRHRSHNRALEKASATRSELREAIEQARKDGHSLQAIGDKIGVTAQRVDAILKASRSPERA